jgi:hypothetical protein
MRTRLRDLEDRLEQRLAVKGGQVAVGTEPGAPPVELVGLADSTMILGRRARPRRSARGTEAVHAGHHHIGETQSGGRRDARDASAPRHAFSAGAPPAEHPLEQRQHVRRRR